MTLEAGYDGEFNRESSDQLLEVLNPSTGTFQTDEVNAFDFDDQTHAFYTELTTPITESIQIKGGVRAEQAFTSFSVPSRSGSFDNRYFSLFPSAFVSYSPSAKYQTRLSYSKRVRRPNSWQLNPIDDGNNPTFRRIGNPQLDPEYIHSFEFSATRRWSPVTLSVTPFFRRTVNEIEQREELRSDGVTVLTFDNFASSNSYGLELITSLQMRNWVRGNVSLNAHRVVTDGSNLNTDLSNDAMSYGWRARLTFRLAEGLDLQMSQFYRAPMDIAGGQMGARTRSNLALQKRLFGGSGSLSVRVSDVFNAMNFNVQHQTDQFYTESTRDWGQRQIMVTFSYSFSEGSNGDRGGADRGGRRGPR